MTWHADPATLARYAEGQIDEARAFSIEAHVLACDECRITLARSVDATRLNHVWSGVHAGMHAPKPKVIEHLLRRLGTPDHYARLLAATPSLSASWLLSVSVALAFALIASHNRTENPLPFLIIAPLLPLAGVAASYSPGLDPTHEIGIASPLRGSTLLMVRSAAVFAVTTILAGLAALALPHIGWTAAAWVLPALGLSVASLALSTWIPPVWASGLVGTIWVGGVIATLARPGLTRAQQLAWFKPAAQVTFCVIAVAAAAVAIIRGDRYDVANR
jgi:hypothetical protein